MKNKILLLSRYQQHKYNFKNNIAKKREIKIEFHLVRRSPPPPHATGLNSIVLHEFF